MKIIVPWLIFWVLVGLPSSSTLAYSTSDSLYRQSMDYLKQATTAETDLSKQIEFARLAAAGFEQLSLDSLWIEATFLVARGAYYLRDSTAFYEAFNPMFDGVLQRQDTNALVRGYNLQGGFFFSQGQIAAGIEALKTPDQQGLYAASSLDANLFNLGALVDVGLGYTMNLDTVYYYVNKLQQLARKYDTPSVQVVSRFKLAQLFSKALNYEESLEILRGAYPYLKHLNNQGFSHFYYRHLISNFINLEMPDSASYYIKVAEKEAAYPEGDPRNCYRIISELRANLDLGHIDVPSEAFESCYDHVLSRFKEGGSTDLNTLSALNAKCSYFLAKKNWPDLDETLALFIEAGTSYQSNLFLANAYEIKYQAMLERDLPKAALEAHQKFKEYNDRINQYVFSQSQKLIRYQLRTQLVEEENKRLQVENQNQRLHILKNRNARLLFILGLLFLALLVTYFVRLARIRAGQSTELSRLVRERTFQLEKANQELITTNKELLESNSELERFAYIASHDLKTPLHNIIKFTGLLGRELKSNDKQEIKEYLAFIIQGGKRMNHLIEDVLAYSKLTKKNNKDKQIIDLKMLIGDIEKSISEYLDSRQATLTVKGWLPTIYWNYAKVFILCKNLIENGVKYNESAAPLLQIYCEKEEDTLTLCFADNGIGIEAPYLEKIFQMFTRLHNQSEYEGSGLGLATCKKIVDEFGGQICCTSTPGTGTVFRITLPRELLRDDQSRDLSA